MTKEAQSIREYAESLNPMIDSIIDWGTVEKCVNGIRAIEAGLVDTASDTDQKIFSDYSLLLMSVRHALEFELKQREKTFNQSR